MTTETTTEAIEALSELTAYNLASMADCGSPDSPESVGAMLLVHVRDAVVEYLEGHDAGQYNEDERDAYAHEIPDGAPSVYTHERWAEFVDLAERLGPQRPLSPIAAADLREALRAEIEGSWGGKPPPPERYVDLSYYEAALKRVASAFSCV